MSTVRLTHIGGPTVVLEVDGWRILTDPTFDPPDGTYSFGLGTSSRKLSGPAIPAAELGAIDAASSATTTTATTSMPRDGTCWPEPARS